MTAGEGKFLNRKAAQREAAAEAEKAAKEAAEAAAEKAAELPILSVLVINGGIEIPSTRPVPGAWRRLWQWLLLGWTWEPVNEEEPDGNGNG